MILHKNLAFAENHATFLTFLQHFSNISSIFLTYNVMPGKFPSLVKVALGTQEIYLLLSIDITRKLSQRPSNFPNFLAFFANFHQFT